MFEQLVEFIKALSALAWPIIVGILAWKLYPDLKKIISSRSFSLKIAGMELSAQDATEQIRSQIDDLQKQVIALKSGRSISTDVNGNLEKEDITKNNMKTILWVDDSPKNNALEIAQLQGRGYEVIQALSSDEARDIISKNENISLVISDMARRENGVFHRHAGYDLLKSIRNDGNKVPFIVYTSKMAASNNSRYIMEAGGSGATSSTVELLQWVEEETSNHSK